MIKAGIVGGAGYTGGELVRLLVHHPQVEIAFVQSRSQAGMPVSNSHPDLLGEVALKFVKEIDFDIDVLFLCMGHGASAEFFEANKLPKQVKVIDLSRDFRSDEDKVYGLPELNKQTIKSATFVANPGCFATAIQLALLPLACKGILKEVHVSGITGATGAGIKPSATTHFSWRAGNISTYKAFTHQHLDEVTKSLLQCQPGFNQRINFIPYRGDFTRGILVTAYQYCEWSLEKVLQVYEDFYEDHPFTWITTQALDLKQVVNTNKCYLNLSMYQGYLMVQSALDNLLKGASGQAVQNMNLMFGLSESTGLKLKGSSF